MLEKRQLKNAGQSVMCLEDYEQNNWKESFKHHLNHLNHSQQLVFMLFLRLSLFFISLKNTYFPFKEQVSPPSLYINSKSAPMILCLDVLSNSFCSQVFSVSYSAFACRSANMAFSLSLPLSLFLYNKEPIEILILSP